MSDLDFAALRALTDIATPGPWVSVSKRLAGAGAFIEHADGVTVIADAFTLADAALAAASREAVPALLDMRDAVLALHVPIPFMDRSACRVCDWEVAVGWPCATARACGVTGDQPRGADQ